MKIILERDEIIEPTRYILKHFIVEAKDNDRKKIESFAHVLIDVAEDMGLKAYEDTTQYLIGKDY
tara:strand:- start:11304 stop:11498 length:195 start_codon:yes stop_codon:yes gene_type:complete